MRAEDPPTWTSMLMGFHWKRAAEVEGRGPSSPTQVRFSLPISF